MSVSWFCIWDRNEQSQGVLDAQHLDRLGQLVRNCPGLLAGHILTPAVASDPHYPDASGSPTLILQLEFPNITTLESHLRPSGHLGCLVQSNFLPNLRGSRVGQQAMLKRSYAVPSPNQRSIEGGISYWVEYSGPAEDENAWHKHYVDHHPQLLAQLPGIRCIEIYTPVVMICGLPLNVRPSMQRNKTVFDSVDAMRAAMQSPARDALRQDFQQFPAWQGTALHFPFNTITYLGNTSGAS